MKQSFSVVFIFGTAVFCFNANSSCHKVRLCPRVFVELDFSDPRADFLKENLKKRISYLRVQTTDKVYKDRKRADLFDSYFNDLENKEEVTPQMFEDLDDINLTYQSWRVYLYDMKNAYNRIFYYNMRKEKNLIEMKKQMEETGTLNSMDFGEEYLKTTKTSYNGLLNSQKSVLEPYNVNLNYIPNDLAEILKNEGVDYIPEDFRRKEKKLKLLIPEQRDKFFEITKSIIVALENIWNKKQ